MIFDKVKTNLEAKGYAVRVFANKEAANEYLTDSIQGKTIGIGGSMTVEEMGLFEKLAVNNTVYWHWRKAPEGANPHVLQDAGQADLYISSVNALSEDGDLVNIDGTCNRVASTLYGHKKVYFVVGQNKLAPTLDKAIERAKSIAAPLNAKRIFQDAVTDESAEKISCALTVFWRKPTACDYEVILIEEELGY